MGQPNVKTTSPERRVKNFEEVALGFSKAQAINESRRCIQCASPVCTYACPLGIDIPGFIRAIREGEPVKALARIKEKSLFASICGRLCPAPCEKACVFEPEGAPIAIRALERFASDSVKEKVVTPNKPHGKKVAVIGSGPSGMAAASELAQKGFEVTVFDLLSSPGGVLRYGIPNFRLPKKVLETEISSLKSLGVTFQSNFFLGNSTDSEELLKQGFSVVLLARGQRVGAPAIWRAPLAGSNLGGVYTAEEFLMRVNLLGQGVLKTAGTFNVGPKVVVIGSGYAALDCARAAVRLKKTVTVIFDHTEDEMPVRIFEKEYTKEEGVSLEPLVKALEILGNSQHFVKGVRCLRMDFADPQSSGRWQLIPVPDSEFNLEANTVILASTRESHKEDAVSLTKGVYSVSYNGHDSIVEAMAAGKKSAQDVERYVTSS